MSKNNVTAKPTTWIDAYGAVWYGCKDGNDVPADMRRKVERNGTAGMPRPRPVPRRVNVSPPLKSIRKPKRWVNEWGVPMYGYQDGNDIPADERRMSRTTKHMILGGIAGYLFAYAANSRTNASQGDTQGDDLDFTVDFGGGD